MNKKVLLGVSAGCAVAGCIAAAAKNKAKHKEGVPRQAMWDKMRQRMEEMPEDFPPRVMFDNVEATKANTEEILGLLRGEGTRSESAGGRLHQ